MRTTKWRKARRSDEKGQCVEVAGTVDGVMVRDSKNPGGGHLRFTKQQWAGLVASIQAGR